jgi:hypothetical protein
MVKVEKARRVSAGDAATLTPTSNLISNNHFTQKSTVSRANYGGLHLRGIG